MPKTPQTQNRPSWADRAPEGMRWAIIVLFVCAIVPILMWMHPVGDYFVETDFYGGYAPGVRALWSTGLDPARYGVVGPVYELLLGLIGLTGIDLFRLAQFLSLASTAFTIALWSGWLERRFGRGAGWIAALLMATNPTFVRYAYTASTDATYVALLSATFVAFFARVPSPRRAALAGILAGLTTLTRYTGIVLVPLGLLAPLWPGRANPWRGRRLLGAGAFFLGVLAVFGPWWVFTQSASAPPSLRFYHNLAYEVYARARGITWDNYQLSLEKEFPTFGSVLARDPAAVVERIVANSHEHMAQAANELWLWPLAALAAAGAATWLLRRLPGAGPVIGLGALLYVSLIPVFYASRYHMPLVPVAATLAALFLTARTALPDFLARVGLRRLTWLVSGFLLAGTVVITTRATIEETRFLATQVPGDVPALGAALKRDWKGEGRPRLIARKPNLSYYADALPVPFVPLDSLESMVRYARDTRADYLYISWPEALLRPPFAFLLVPEFAPRGLELVSAGHEGHSALYRITPEFGSEMPEWYPREWDWHAGEGMTRVQPNVPEYWLAAGEGRHARKDYAGAHEAYEIALRLKPNWSRAYVDLGNLWADQGEFQPALQAFEAALRSGETNPILFRNLGLAAARTGDLARAEEMITRYVNATRDPAFVPMLEQLRAQRATQGAAQ